MTHGSVVVAGRVAKERLIAGSRVTKAGAVIVESRNTNCRIFVTSRITTKRNITDSSIVICSDICRARCRPAGRVMRACRVVMEGVGSIRRVLATTSVAKEGIRPNRCVPVGIGTITEEGERADHRVAKADGIAKRALSPTAALEPRSVLLKRANPPLAVLPTAVVLLKSAPAPVAVFSAAVFTRSEPAPTPVQKLPSVRLRSEYIPIALLYVPVVRLKRAFAPSAVLPPG